MAKEIVLPLQPTDTRTFSGSAFTRLIGSADRDVPIKLYYVRFEAGAKTHWHSHSGAQILVVREGLCRYQRAGEPVQELAAGESVRFDPGERHWHGASATAPAEHIAINLDSRETTWFEAVEL